MRWFWEIEKRNQQFVETMVDIRLIELENKTKHIITVKFIGYKDKKVGSIVLYSKIVWIKTLIKICIRRYNGSVQWTKININ